MQKTKYDDAEESTVNNFYKIIDILYIKFQHFNKQ